MRSRFSAFVTGDVDYLLASWDPSTRPETLELDTAQLWYRLDILHTEHGAPGDDTGLVEFRAFFRHPEGAGEQHEASNFRSDTGTWYYVDGR